MEGLPDIPIDPQLMEAGSSRSPPRPAQSPPPSTLPPIAQPLPDVVKEEQAQSITTTEGVKADEDVALLLNIAAAAVEPIPHPESALLQSISPKGTAPFPFTPPDEASLVKPLSSTSSALPPSQPPNQDTPSSLIRSPSPKASTSTSVPKSTKGKRRRTTEKAGPSRRYSTDPDRPAHYMGEDNTTIRCICGIEEDDGFTIQCEGCFAWEHGLCFGYTDEESAPDKYYCELCDPRPVDPELARARQTEAKTFASFAEQSRLPSLLNPAKGVPSGRPKGRKRPRQTQTATDGETDQQMTDLGKDPSATVQPTKPKRKVTAGKPRSKPSVHEPTPGPSVPPVFKEPLPPVDFDDEYFTVEPWTLEYTPVRVNVVRGVVPRRRMAEFYHEWVDAELDEVGNSKRNLTNPSGLPSPTETGVLRLSPDHLFPSLDFDILAPPVPPVRLTGEDLAEMSARTHVELIEDTTSFMPLDYAEVASAGVYARPAIYGVFIDKATSLGSLLGEYLGEVVDSESYRRDPTNQYAGLGTTKPYVRSLGPPINLVIDARGYGSDMRFMRNSCHPNAVLRPILLQQDDEHRPLLKFGVFAARSIARGEEITLGWEWDDQHVVHALRNAVLTNLAPERDFGLTTMDVQKIASKCDTVLTHLFGTFNSCACDNLAMCTLAQMRLLAQGKEPEVELNERGKVKVDFGRLVGAVRGWRRKELELEDSKRWRIPGLFRQQKSAELERKSLTARAGKRRRLEDVDMSADEDGDEEDNSIVEGDDQSEDEAQEDVSMASEDEETAHPARTPPPSSPLTPAISTSKPLPTLSGFSVISSRSTVGEEEDDGAVSDATSVTVPRSELSEAEELTPVKTSRKKSQNTSGPIEAQRNTQRHMSHGTRKRAREGRSPAGRPYNIERAGDSTDSDEPSDRSSRLSPPQSEHISTPSHSPSAVTKALPNTVIVKKGKESLAVDWMDEFTFSNRSGSPRRNDTIDSALSSDLTSRKGRRPMKKEETYAVVPDQVVAPMSEPMEAVPVDDEMVVDPVVPVEEPVRETTPPREVTPVREPTPEPPKKVSFAEYMKTKKLKQDVATPSMDEAPLAAVVTEEPASIDDTTAEGTQPAEVSLPSVSPPVSTLPPSASPSVEIKAEAVEAARVNLSDFLPSYKANGAPATPASNSTPLPAESPRSLATPSASFVPRSEYFPQQQVPNPSSSAFVPRSTSFAPRTSLTPSEESNAPASSAFMPRQPSESPGFPPFAPRAPDGSIVTPPQPSTFLPDTPNGGIPPVLPMRDPPPHTPASIPSKPPPTGPKAPPTGPRGVFAPPAAIPNRPIDSSMGRGGFGGPPRGFAPRGGYAGRGDRFDDRGFGGRGRGGFRGRGRGM